VSFVPVNLFKKEFTMACTLPIPTVLAHGRLPDDIEKLIGFILHGVSHMLDDGVSVPMTYFGLPDDPSKVVVMDTRNMGDNILQISQEVRGQVQEHQLTRIACLSEAWKLPEDKKQDFIDGISPYKHIADHPDKFDILLITVETQEGIWMMDCPIHQHGDKRRLPESITFDLVPPTMEPHPQFLRMLDTRVPAGAYLH
jgi:hypothetical protein